MTAKNYLKQYKSCEQSIAAKIEECEQLEALATKTNRALGGPRVQGAHTDRMAIVDRIIDIEHQIHSEIDELQKIRADTVTTIKKIKDERLRTVLYLRYICGNKWEQIACKVNYDYRWVLRLHGEALREVDKLIRH